MNRESYISALTQVYDEFYILPGGYCRYFEKCKEGIQPCECKFASDKALVGLHYGSDEKIPKVVFVGLEGLRENDIIVVQDIEETSTRVFNPHYRGARYVAAYLLNGIAGTEQPRDALKKSLIQYSETLEYISLINCYKCAFSQKAQGLPHSQAMRDNCQDILFKEIEALEPDILVIQIKTNRPTNLETKLAKYHFCAENKICGDSVTGAYSCFLPSGKPLILIWTYHGSGDPEPTKRAWVNDNKGGNVYMKKELNPVLDAAISTYKQFSF